MSLPIREQAAAIFEQWSHEHLAMSMAISVEQANGLVELIVRGINAGIAREREDRRLNRETISDL